MNPQVLTSYQWSLVALSFLISVSGAFVALTAATRVKQTSEYRSINILAAGTALGGVGVWAMHFVGMLALDLDVASSFSMIETGISLALAVLAAAFSLGFVSKAPDSLARMLGAGTLLGTSVAFMHYLGMYGMKFGGFIRWDYGMVAISLVIAVVAATAALWLAFNSPSLNRRILASLVMAVAVCAMHYTGMSAAEFVCTTANRNAIPQGFGYISSFALASLVTVAAFSMVLLIALDQFLQRTVVAPKNVLKTSR